MTELYIILGTPDSGRREIVAQLLDGLPGETFVYVSRDEPDSAGEAALRANESVEILDWHTDGVSVDIKDADDAPERVVFILDGRANPVDQLEILAALAPRLEWSVKRIITVVDCRLASREPVALADYYKACIHFSDVVLLNRREGLAPSFDREFRKPYEAECVPALFEATKKGRVANPDLILLPEARRITLAFDEERDVFDEMEFDEDNLPEDPFDIKLDKDKYFERDERGARCIQIPDIKAYLPKA